MGARRRDILVPMTRRYAMLLSLSAPVVAQVCSSNQLPEAAAPSRDSPLQWKPCPVFNGAPILFKSKAYSGPATWLGQKIEFRPDGDAFYALAGVNMNRTPGRYPLDLGRESVEVTVTRHTYPSSTITVPQKFVEPPKEIQMQIDEEVMIKQGVFKSSHRSGSGKDHSSRRPIRTTPLHSARGGFTTARHEAFTRVSITQPRRERKFRQPTPVAS